MNKTMLTGNIIQDMELKYTMPGAAVADFSLAVNSIYINSDGHMVDDVCYYISTLWPGAG